MKLSRNGINFIKRFEGFAASSYRCPGGVWTIGYGSTRHADGRAVKLNDERISEEEAHNLLVDTVKDFEAAVNELVTVPLNQNQFDALVSFTYNLGIGAFAKSTLLRRVNQKWFWDVGNQLNRWVFSGGKKLPGLVRRRKEEAELFYKKPELKLI